MSHESHEPEQSFNLPAPHTEYGSLSNEEQTFMPTTEKAASKAVEQTPNPFLATGGPDPVTASNNPAAAPPAPLAMGMMPLIADDADLIEKEWVEKAKQIVDNTRHDPYSQNKQLTKVKADYLKKRYNKDIKLDEE